MLVIDSETAQKLAAQKAAEERERAYQRWMDDYERLSKFYDDPEIQPGDAARQIGTPMLHTELERRLVKLNPKLRFQFGKFNSHHKVVYVDRGDKLEHLLIYPVGAVPERTIWKKQEEWIPRRNDQYKPSSQDHSAADWEWVPIEGYEQFYRADGHKVGGWGDPAMLAKHPDMPYWGEWRRRDENVGRAGWKKLNHAWGKAKRGWREVILMLVQMRLLTPDQVEREFHSDANNPLWKQGLGKGFTTANVV